MRIANATEAVLFLQVKMQFVEELIAQKVDGCAKVTSIPDLGKQELQRLDLSEN